MALMHHAFRCPASKDIDGDISPLLALWAAGDLAGLSALALAGYAPLAGRDDINAAFHFHPEGPASSWMAPNFISPALAALAVLAARFVPIHNLSASGDTNHHLLETQLPLLGWSSEDVGLLVRGRPIAAMLAHHAMSAASLDPGGFPYTGGWTSGRIAHALKVRLDRLSLGISARADAKMGEAWSRLHDSGALADARAMLAEIGDDDWLVMAITE